MPLYREIVTDCPALLPRQALVGMIRLVRLLYRLSRLPAYRQAVLSGGPPAAQFNPGHDAVMMGYDFHLDAAGQPRLIEVNTNAGGGLLAYLAHHPTAAVGRERLPERLRRDFLQAFAEEMQGFSRGALPRPGSILILDEEPERQFLYQEMVVFEELFRDWGAESRIADPARLQAGEEGVFAAGRRVDLIYNRHCDFYLESPAMAGIRAAYLAGNICLTPNPFVYGLLGDKRRLILWSDPHALAVLGVAAEDIVVLTEMVPESHLLGDLDRETVWEQRRQWVFKPVSRFGSRGVLLGRKISRSRFDALPAAEMLVQREVPPSETACPDGPPLKTDFRLYVYRDAILGVAARLYQGQVTNLRTRGGGFAPVRLVAG